MGRTKRISRTRIAKSRMRQHKRSVLLIGSVMMIFVVVFSVGSMKLREKNEEYIRQEMELTAQIEEEKARTEEIEKMRDYVGSDEYIETVAKEKLGLAKENEIIFKPEE